MTDQELNEAVAKKLGWKWGPNQPARQKVKGEWIYGGLPNYCHSIEAAWEIVASLQTLFAFIELEYARSQKHWICKLSKGWDNTTQHEWRDSAIADTAPMAICLAFLKLK